MNALANKEVGEFVGTHFVSAYKKVGTFRKDGNTKTGGNVATYFCLADQKVVHVIPGPVDAATFLREARWAVDVAESAALEHPNNMDQQKAYLKQAHAHRYLTDRNGFVPRPGKGVSQAPRVNNAQMPTTEPRGDGLLDQAHWHLWSKPLPRLRDVYKTVWTKILNEPLTDLPVRGQ